MTRPSELREMHDQELFTRLAEARHELFNLRFQHVTGQLDNFARLGQVRKDIARMSTVLREREIAKAEAGETEADTEQEAAAARRARVLGSRRAAARAARRAHEEEEE